MGDRYATSKQAQAGGQIKAGGNDGKILTSTLWNQSGTVYISINGTQTALSGVDYNAYCPYYMAQSTGSSSLSTTRAVTGCTNTADSQIIYYWLEQGYDFDFEVAGDDWYEVSTTDEAGTEVVYLADVSKYKGGDIETINGLLSQSDHQTSEFIAALNYYCGIKNHSQYGSSTSTYVYITDDYSGDWNLLVYKALGFDSHYSVSYNNTDFFNVSGTGESQSIFLTDLGYAIVRECLDYGEVISVGIPAHSIYLDGYRYNSTTASYEYHLNYGWGINSNSTKWYSEEEMKAINIDTLGLDITPRISAHVSNVSGGYNAGTMLRAMERINHTQNDTSVVLTFADSMENSVSTQQETFAIFSDVDVAFENLDFSLVFSADYGILSYNALTFPEVTGNLVLNSTSATSDSILVGVAGDETLSVSLNGAGVFCGGYTATESLLSALEEFGSLGYESVAVYEDYVTGYAFAALGGNDNITLAGNSVVMGNIDLGSGNNTITIKSGSTWYGDLESAATLEFVLESQSDEAFVIVADDLSSFSKNATIHVTMNQFTQGAYTLVDASEHSSPVTYLSNLSINVTSGGVTETLSINGTAQGKLARLYLDNGILKLTDTTGSSTPTKYTGVMVYSSGAMKISDSYLEGLSLSAGSTDSMYVGSNGTAASMVVGSGGIMHVLSEGLALETAIQSNGKVQVSSGGSAQLTAVRASGTLNVLYGGVAESTEIKAKGFVDVASNGIVSDTRIQSNGILVVRGSAMENYVSGGKLLVSAGGSADLSYVASDGNLIVYENGIAYDTTVEKGGFLVVSQGGKANGILLDQGLLQVNSGGNAASATIDAFGKAYVNRGGVLQSANVELQGNLFVQNGGSARNIQVNSWGNMIISNGGKGEYIQVNSGGILTVERGGSSFNTTLTEGDLLLHGGIANSLHVSSGGRVYASNGARINGGAVYSSGYAIISSGAIASGLALKDEGLMEVEANATVRNVTVSSGGSMYMRTGAEFLDLTVSSGGTVNGFTMNATNTLTGQSLQLSNCVVNNEASLEKGQSATNVTVYDWAELNVLDGASISNMTAYAGALINGFNLNEEVFTSSGVVLKNVYADGSAFLYKGQSVEQAEIVSGAVLTVSGGKLISGSAYAGATINGLHLQADNEYTSGLTVSHAHVAHGNAFVKDGNQAEAIIVDQGGTLLVQSGSVNSLTLLSGGRLNLASGGSAVNIRIQNGGAAYIANETTVSKTTVYGGGTLQLASGATVDTLTLASNGQVTVGNGAAVNKTTLWQGGNLILSSGAAATKTLIEYGGGLHVYNGATASGTVVCSGGYYGVGSGATVYDTTIDYAGAMTVWEGGAVHSNTIGTWGAIILSSGAVGNSTTILAKGGYHIYNGARAYTTEVTSGAFLGIGLGGMVYNLQVQTGAGATFYDDSILRGWNDFAGNITVNEDVDAAGAMIAFNLTDRTAGEANIISNAAGITGASYYVTVDSSKASGNYMLAGNASGINSVMITGTSTLLTVGGEAATLDGNTYFALNRDSYNNLYLAIAKVVEPSASWDDVDLGIWDDPASMSCGSLISPAEEEKTSPLLAIL